MKTKKIDSYGYFLYNKINCTNCRKDILISNDMFDINICK